MKILLKDFQASAVEQLVDRLRKAAREASDHDLQSVCLSAPTGSGKTVMAAAALESILQGDDDHLPQSDATFLWVTDQPELNEQTRRKILAASSFLTDATMVVIDSTFDQELLRGGCVYFLNIQKLGKDKALVSLADHRTFSIWETITNTAVARPKAFFVILDEAHRGMAETPRSRTEANTIIQKFIKGSPGELPPIPLVVGVSATPDRFNRLIEGTPRTSRSVVVPPEDVRVSGLLKDVITLYHPDESQPSDMTMLRAAARSYANITREWHEYCTAESEPIVEPILVVQVQDGTASTLSKTDIAEAITAIRDELGSLPNEAFAHCFQEGARLQVSGQELRYIAPPDIQGDPAVRVVFFKTSLNSGWDCPRAEVMMSFRTALDATLIAQLVGRMVRTPLARRIDTNEQLNSVPLYLPHYDQRGLATVIENLTKADADTLGPVRVEKGDTLLKLVRAPGTDHIFGALAALPSYTIPRGRRSSEVRRLMKLARLLARDQLDEDAPENATDLLLAALREAYGRVSASTEFRAVIEEKAKLQVRAVEWRLATQAADDKGVIELDVAGENIEDLFEAAGRKIGEGLHKAWWRLRVQEDANAVRAARLEVFALCMNSEVMKGVQELARQHVQTWLRQHAQAIGGLPEGRQQSYDEIRRLAMNPETTPLSYPRSVEGRNAGRPWSGHLFVDVNKVYREDFNAWETKVLEAELDRPDVVAWLRNPPRKAWSLCVPYELSGEYRGFYPDFIVVRKDNGSLVTDLIDPHSLELADAPAKAAGFAQYAAKHYHCFGRMLLVVVDRGQLLTLDLADEVTRDRVKAVKTHEHLRQLYQRT